MSDDSPQGLQQLRAALVAFLLITVIVPVFRVVAGVLTGYNQFRDQGWRYFVPTWRTLGTLVGLTSFAAFLFVPTVFARDAFADLGTPMIYVWGFAVLGGGIAAAIAIETMEDRTGRKKVFAFAEVENGE